MFNQTHDNKPENFKGYDKHPYNRYLAPEQVVEERRILVTDVWIIGCIFIELFSDKCIWYGYKETQMLEELRKFYVPKIFSDVPHSTWGLICECLNPFDESRINSKELLDRYVKLMFKMNNPLLTDQLKRFSNEGETSKKASEELGDPKVMRKCPLHPKLDGKCDFNLKNTYYSFL